MRADDGLFALFKKRNESLGGFVQIEKMFSITSSTPFLAFSFSANCFIFLASPFTAIVSRHFSLVRWTCIVAQIMDSKWCWVSVRSDSSSLVSWLYIMVIDPAFVPFMSASHFCSLTKVRTVS